MTPEKGSSVDLFTNHYFKLPLLRCWRSREEIQLQFNLTSESSPVSQTMEKTCYAWWTSHVSDRCQMSFTDVCELVAWNVCVHSVCVCVRACVPACVWVCACVRAYVRERYCKLNRSQVWDALATFNEGDGHRTGTWSYRPLVGLSS